MKGVWLLSWRHTLHHRGRTIILTLCIAVSLFLPAAANRLIGRYRSELVARADATPLVAGAKGNRFDLTLAALYFRQSELDTVPYSECVNVSHEGLGIGIPLNVRFTAREKYPIVATSPEYFELRGLRAASGRLPTTIGEVAVGHDVAEAEDLAVGSYLFSNQREQLELSIPSALKMRVCGVLSEADTPDNEAVFVDIKTAWILEGLAHGHDDDEKLDPSLTIGRSEQTVVYSGKLIEDNEVTTENIDSFHVHGDDSLLPLSGFLVVPRDAKSGTILKARLNASAAYQMVVPRAVIDDLMAFVFRIKSMFDTLSAVLAGCTVLLTGLVITLSLRLRAREMDTLNRIGCSRFTVVRLYAVELAIIVILSALIAGAGVLAVDLLAPNLVRVL